MKSMPYAFALSAAIAFAGVAISVNPAVAANSAMADCNKQWNDATAAKTTNGVAYQDFLKACLKKNSSATTGAATTTTTDTKTKPAAGTATDTTMTAAATTDAATTKDTKAKKDCNAQWKAAKADGSAGTQKKKDFVDACLAKAGVTPTDATMAKKPAATTGAATTGTAATTTTTTMAPATDTATPPEPTGNAAAATDTKTKDGKPKSAGQIAMDVRIKQCGADWKKAKADGTTNGLKWPQFWSACNKRLKAAGQ